MAALARKACALPVGVSFAKAWSVAMPPPLCGSRAAPDVLPPVQLPSSSGATSAATSTEAQELRPSWMRAADKSFKMHIGGSLHIPTNNARERPMYSHPLPAAAGQQQQVVIDPFEGMPFRAFAERMGEKIMPTMQAAREAERYHKRAARQATEEAEVVMPLVPHVLPFTRWAASSTQFRDTFIADAPKDRKKARLSWYHPEDTMVPRDWFRGGLLEDIKYYMPFGLGASSAAAAKSATA